MKAETSDHREKHNTIDYRTAEELAIIEAVVNHFVENNGIGIDRKSLFTYCERNGNKERLRYRKSFFDNTVRKLLADQRLFISYKGELAKIGSHSFLKVNLTPTPKLLNRFYPGKSKELFWYPNGGQLALPLTLREIFIKIANTIGEAGLRDTTKGIVGNCSGLLDHTLEHSLKIFSELKLLEFYFAQAKSITPIKSIALTENGIKIAKQLGALKKGKIQSVQQPKHKLATTREQIVLFVLKEKGDDAFSYLLKYFEYRAAVSNIVSSLAKKGLVQRIGDSFPYQYFITSDGEKYLEKHYNRLEMNKGFVLEQAKIPSERGAAKNSAIQATPYTLYKGIKSQIDVNKLRDLYAMLDITPEHGIKLIRYLLDHKYLYLIKSTGGERYLISDKRYQVVSNLMQQKKSAQQQPLEK